MMNSALHRLASIALRGAVASATIAAAVVSVNVITPSSSAAAAGFGPDSFMAIDGSLRYIPADGGTYGWANSGTPTPSTACPSGAVNVTGSGGLFNCGAPNSADTPSVTYPPIPPTYIGPAVGSSPSNVISETFVSSNINSDSTNCPGGTVVTGSNIFGGGEKWTSPIDSLTYSIGSATPKDQFDDVSAVARINSSKQVELYFAGERPVTNGDTHMDFQFLQNPVTGSAPCSGSFSGNRAQGDFIVEINFNAGGTNPQPALYVWECNGSTLSSNPATGTICGTSYPNATWVQDTSVPTSDFAIASNSAPIPCGGWVCQDTTAATLPAYGLMEGALNLTAVAASLDGGTLGCATTLWPETRSAGSGSTSQLKAFAPPLSFDTCQQTTTKTAPNTTTVALGQSNSDSATVTGTAAAGLPTGSVTFYECGPFTGTISSTSGCDPTSSGAAKLGTVTTPTPSGSYAEIYALPSADAFTAKNPGVYCFAGVYTPAAGNLYQSSSDTSSDECFTVTKITPTVTTAPTKSTVVLGTSNSDVATITGTGTTTPSGTVQFYVCGPDTTATACTTTAANVSDLGTVNLGGANGTDTIHATSPSFTATSTGTYCFLGVYSGDSTYAGGSDSSTTNECFSVGAAASTTTTKASASSIVLGPSGSVSDTVTVTGNATGGAPAGSVTFSVCGPTATGADALCTPTATNTVGSAATLTKATSDTSTATTSTAFTPTTVGTYCFAAVYTPTAGSNYSGSSDNVTGTIDTNECFSVGAAASTTTTKASASSIVLGPTGSVSDTVTVTGNATGGAPAGSVTFSVCGPTATGADALCTPTDSNTVGTPATLTKATSDTSTATTTSSFTPTTVGTYCFAAVYTPTKGSNYTGSSDNVTGTIDTNECFSVTSPPPPPVPTTATTIGTGTTTQASAGSVLLGQSFSDTATVSSGTSAPDGTVTFSLCGPTAAVSTCTPSSANTAGNAISLTTVPGTDTSTATSTTVTPAAVGIYCFAAVYTPTAGSSYAGSSDNTTGTPSAAECVDVVEPILTVVKSSSPSSGSVVAPGTPVTYTLTLTNTGSALASDVTIVDTVPTGTTYVAGSASCGDVPTTVCSVSEHGGVVTWSGVDVAAESGATPGTATVSFGVLVASADTNGQVISNVASFTNEHTPSCTAATCSTNTVTLTVVVPVVKSTVSPPPVVKSTVSPPPVVKAATSAPAPVPAATTVHSGEPWAGSRPYEAAAFAAGLVLVGFGARQRRRLRRAVHRRP